MNAPSSIASNKERIACALTNARERVKGVLLTAQPSLQRLSAFNTVESRKFARTVIGLDDNTSLYLWDETHTVALDCEGHTEVKGETPVDMDLAMTRAKAFVQRITDGVEAYMTGDDATTEAIVSQFDKAAR